MLFRVEGKVYVATPGCKHPYTEVEISVADGVKSLEAKAGGIDVLPADAYPMTYDECIARMEPAEAKPSKRRKGGEKVVPDVQ